MAKHVNKRHIQGTTNLKVFLAKPDVYPTP